jgi:hypothetical protein
MKKLIKAASLLSAGAAVLTSPHLEAASSGGKPWTFSLGLRGFYDDNIFTGNNNILSQRRVIDSWGFEVTPGVRFDIPLDQSSLSVSYTYGLRYFENRPGSNTDQFHIANVNFSHNFSPRLRLDLYDSLSIAQEPEQTGSGANNIATFLRAEGSNLRNSAGMNLNYQFTPLWSGVLGYQNNYYDYSSDLFDDMLNRMEHLPSIGVRYHYSPRTVVGLNYQYGIINYSNAAGEFRDQHSQYIFASLDHSFSSRLVGAFRGGVQLVEWQNPPPGAGVRDTAQNPFFDASLTYNYSVGSNVQLGVRHSRNATDVLGLEFGDFAYDQESTMVYGALNHAFTGRFRGSLVGQYQNSDFYAVSNLADQGEHYFNVGVTFNYRLSQYLSAEVAYYFDRLSSDIDFRNYDRNRVFFGIRATY